MKSIPEWAGRPLNTLRREFSELQYNLEREYQKGVEEVLRTCEDENEYLRKMHELVYRFERDYALGKKRLILEYFS